MWICSKLGFFSLTRKAPGDCWLVSARAERDLRALAAASGLDAEVLAFRESDHTCVLEVDRPGLARVFAVLADSLDYGNFKDCLAALPEQRDRLAAYDDFWRAMRTIQEEAAHPRATGAARNPVEVARHHGGYLARLLETLNGFKDKYGHWPTRLRLSRTACTALQEKHLTRPGFSALAAKLELKVGNNEELVAEDDAGLAYDYSKEGWASRRPPQEADNWLWQVKI